MDLIPTSSYHALRSPCYRNKSISLQPHCRAVPPQISHGQWGQPHSGLSGLGVLWQCGKEPQNKRMYMEHWLHLCSSPGTFYSSWLTFCYHCFSDIPLFQKRGVFIFLKSTKVITVSMLNCVDAMWRTALCSSQLRVFTVTLKTENFAIQLFLTNQFKVQQTH